MNLEMGSVWRAVEFDDLGPLTLKEEWIVGQPWEPPNVWVLHSEDGRRFMAERDDFGTRYVLDSVAAKRVVP